MLCSALAFLVLNASEPSLGGQSVSAQRFFQKAVYVGRAAGPSKIELRAFVRELYGQGATSVTLVGIHRVGSHSRLGANGVRWRMPLDMTKRDRVLRSARTFVVDHIDPQAEWKKLFRDTGQKYEVLGY